jgi:GNAT superfamily N-acetyltransferase
MLIEPLAARDLPEVFDLYRRAATFPPPDRLDEYWRWKFCDNPHRGDAPPFWVARQDGTVIGGMAQMPVILQVDGQAVPAGWAVDFMVDLRFRRQGVGRRIFDHYRQRNDVAISMGYGPGSATSRIARAVGFHGFPPRRYLFRLLTTRPLTRRLPLGGFVSPIVDPVSRFVLRRVGRVRSRSRLHVRVITRFTPSFDVLWKRVAMEARVTVRRDHGTMNWRYFDNPFQPYTVLGAWDGADLAGCLVSKVVRHTAFNYGTIAELVVPLDAVTIQESLLARAMELFEEAGVDIVKTLDPSTTLSASLHRAGFRSFGRGCDVVIAVAPTVDAGLGATVRDPGAWYLMKGDCDLDMVPDFMSQLSPNVSTVP